tara:strand:+ start:267 stop:1241 length:975 start_codon:yes stop_codon:yes gene_type:complete
MPPQTSHIQYISTAIITDKPVRKTPYQVKGSIMKNYPKTEIVPMLNGSYRKKYLYPRVQVKILNEKIYFLGIAEGVSAVKSLIDNFKALDFGNITFKIKDIIIDENGLFEQTDHINKYKFITPWVALNRTNIKKFSKTSTSQKRKFLCELLTRNLIFLTSEFKIDFDEKILTDIELKDKSLSSFNENRDVGFEGSFLTNFLLPDFIGLGNGITRGYGSIKHEQNIKDEEIDISKFYMLDKKNINSKSNNKKKSLKRRKKSLPKKTITNEENEINYNTLKNNISNSAAKNKKTNSKKFKKKKASDRSFNNINFNSEEYHKKQHSI